MNKYRANRRNYFVGNIGIILLLVIYGATDYLTNQFVEQAGLNVAAGLFSLAFFIYFFVIWTRIVILRTRDFNFPGWAGFLLAFFLSPAAIVFAVIPGTAGTNKYGHQPPADLNLRSVFFK